MNKKVVLVFVVMWLIILILVSCVWAENFNMELIGNWETPDNDDAVAICVQGDYAYLITYHSNNRYDLHIIKISDPKNIEETGSLSIKKSFYFRIIILKTYIYAVFGGYLYDNKNDIRGGFDIIDITEMRKPRYVSTFWFDTQEIAPDIVIRGDYAYVAISANTSEAQTSLQSLNISDPVNPRRLGICLIDDSRVQGLCLKGNYVYIEGSYILYIFDITDPVHMVQKICHNYSPIIGQFMGGGKIIGNYLYLSYYKGFIVMDITDPIQPRLIGNYAAGISSGMFYIQKFYVLENYVYYIGEDSDFHVFDVSKPLEIREVGFYQTPGVANSVWVESGLIYLGDSKAEGTNTGAGLVILKLIPNQFPAKPENLSPPDGVSGATALITLKASSFSDSDGNSHKASEWQVFAGTGEMIFDSNTDTANLAKITLSQGVLNYDTVYSWQVRYQDDHNMWSEWSDKTSFTTMSREQFSFAQITDAHVGYMGIDCSNALYPLIPLPFCKVTISYLNFLDALLEINALNPRPEFILASGDITDWASKANLESFQNAISNQNINQIPVYFVPGNHDRYEHPFSSITEWAAKGRGNNQLSQYYQSVKKPDEEKTDISILAGFAQYGAPSESVNQGLDYYNYWFAQGGHFIVGLDSGADFNLGPEDLRQWILGGADDWGPEAAGLHAEHIAALKKLPDYVPKIIFMHHPVFTDHKDDDLPDASITKQNAEFIDYCKDNNVRAVLSGHTHEDHFFVAKGESGEEVKNPVDWTPEKNFYPWFVQTVSITRDSGKYDRGYRIVTVDGDNLIMGQSASTHFWPKIVISNAGNNSQDYGPVTLNVYDSQNRRTGFGSIVTDIPGSYYNGYYAKDAPQIIVLYNTQDNYKFTVKGIGEGNYSLGIAYLQDENHGAAFAALEIPINNGANHRYSIDWGHLSENSGVVVEKDNNSDGIFEEQKEVGSIYTLQDVYSLSLKEGWNFISLPIAPNDQNAEIILAPLTGKISALWSYDQLMDWQIFILDLTNDLATLNPGQGYWLEMYEPAELLIIGQKINNLDILLNYGWNLIGWPYLVERNVEQVISSLPQGTVIYGYDSENQKWLRYINNPCLNFLNTLKKFEPGKGYWIWNESDFLWKTIAP